MGWVLDHAPALRSKGPILDLQGPDNKVRGFGGVTAELVGAVALSTGEQCFAVWFQDLGWVKVPYGNLPGYQGEGLLTHLSPMDFDPFIHLVNGVPILKIWVRHWHGDGQRGGTVYILDTGYSYH